MIKFINLNNGYTYMGDAPYIHWFPGEQSTNLIYTMPLCILSDKEKLSVYLESEVFTLIDSNVIDSNLDKNKYTLHDVEYFKFEDLITTSFDSFGEPYKATNNNYYVHLIYITAHSTEGAEYIEDLHIDDQTFQIGADFYEEDENLGILLRNFGTSIPQSVQKCFLDNNVREESVDNIMINRKFKELLSNYWDIMVAKGSYKSMINSLKWFEWGDNLKLKEIWSYDNMDNIKYEERPLAEFSNIYKNSIYGYSKTTFVSLRYAMQQITQEIDDEQNPVLESLVSKWTRKDLQLKLSLLHRFYETYFLPIHVQLFESAIEDIVFTSPNVIVNTPLMDRYDNIYNTKDFKMVINNNQPVKISNVSVGVDDDTMFANSIDNLEYVEVDPGTGDYVYEYKYVGDGKGNYIHINEGYKYMGKGKGDYVCNYKQVGEGEGDYILQGNGYQYVGDGLGDYVTDYQYVGDGKGDYILQSEGYEEVDPGTGDYEYHPGEYIWQEGGNLKAALTIVGCKNLKAAGAPEDQRSFWLQQYNGLGVIVPVKCIVDLGEEPDFIHRELLTVNLNNSVVTINLGDIPVDLADWPTGEITIEDRRLIGGVKDEETGHYIAEFEFNILCKTYSPDSLRLVLKLDTVGGQIFTKSVETVVYDDTNVKLEFYKVVHKDEPLTFEDWQGDHANIYALSNTDLNSVLNKDSIVPDFNKNYLQYLPITNPGEVDYIKHDEKRHMIAYLDYKETTSNTVESGEEVVVKTPIYTNINKNNILISNPDLVEASTQYLCLPIENYYSDKTYNVSFKVSGLKFEDELDNYTSLQVSYFVGDRITKNRYTKNDTTSVNYIYQYVKGANIGDDATELQLGGEIIPAPTKGNNPYLIIELFGLRAYKEIKISNIKFELTSKDTGIATNNVLILQKVDESIQKKLQDKYFIDNIRENHINSKYLIGNKNEEPEKLDMTIPTGGRYAATSYCSKEWDCTVGDIDKDIHIEAKHSGGVAVAEFVPFQVMLRLEKYKKGDDRQVVVLKQQTMNILSNKQTDRDFNLFYKTKTDDIGWTFRIRSDVGHEYHYSSSTTNVIHEVEIKKFYIEKQNSFMTCVSKEFWFDPTTLSFWKEIEDYVYRNDQVYFSQFHKLEPFAQRTLNEAGEDELTEDHYTIRHNEVICVVPKIVCGGKDHDFVNFTASNAITEPEMSADGEDVELNEYQPMWEFENTVTKEVFKYDYIMQPYIIGDKKELTPGYYTVTFRYKLSDAYDRKEVKIGPVFIKK